MARELDHPPSLASSLAVDALLLALVNDNAALGASTDQLVAVANNRARFRVLERTGNDLSRLDNGHKWRFG